MIRIRTEHSVYELDSTRRVIRRVSGDAPPTACFAPDGEWKPYDAMSFLEIGRRAQVQWTEDALHGFSVLSNVTALEEV